MVKCNCNDWKKSMPQIDGAQTLADLHGGKYTGTIFKYCPWCGQKLIPEFEQIGDCVPMSCDNGKTWCLEYDIIQRHPERNWKTWAELNCES